jgi:hypothetical protein
MSGRVAFTETITRDNSEIAAIRAINRRAKIKAMPRVAFRCGHDPFSGPDAFEIGIYWARDMNALECELTYRKWIALRWRWRLNMRWRLKLKIDRR